MRNSRLAATLSAVLALVSIVPLTASADACYGRRGGGYGRMGYRGGMAYGGMSYGSYGYGGWASPAGGYAAASPQTAWTGGRGMMGSGVNATNVAYGGWPMPGWGYSSAYGMPGSLGGYNQGSFGQGFVQGAVAGATGMPYYGGYGYGGYGGVGQALGAAAGYRAFGGR